MSSETGRSRYEAVFKLQLGGESSLGDHILRLADRRASPYEKDLPYWEDRAGENRDRAYRAVHLRKLHRELTLYVSRISFPTWYTGEGAPLSSVSVQGRR
jgi:hypothetical protein